MLDGSGAGLLVYATNVCGACIFANLNARLHYLTASIFQEQNYFYPFNKILLVGRSGTNYICFKSYSGIGPQPEQLGPSPILLLQRASTAWATHGSQQIRSAQRQKQPRLLSVILSATKKILKIEKKKNPKVSEFFLKINTQSYY